MTILLPSPPNFTRSTFGLEAHTQAFTSPLTRNTQRVVLAGARWTFSGTIRRMRKDEKLARDWISFFLQCEGMANTFNAYDPDRRTALGKLGGTPLVNGGSQTGSTLTIDGCTANVTNWAMAGDYFAVNGEFKQLTAPVNTNGSGQATLSFKPALRASPADNAAVDFLTPTCTMILTDDKQGVWDADANGVYEEKSFSAVEVF